MKYGFGRGNDFNVDVRVLFWNINGFTELIKSAEVLGWLNKNCDICFVSETHMTKGENFDIENFKCINHPFSDVLGSKPRGGVMCMIKDDYMQYVTKINRDIPDNIVITFHGGHTIFGSYIPPSDSIYYNETCFASIPNIFQNDDGSRVILGGGDLNSRVGNIVQTLPLLGASYRPNVDKMANTHGKLFKKICRSYNCYVLNNLTIGNKEFDGDFTFSKGGRKSQNDICVSNAAGLRNTEEFSIHRIGWNFSDHFPISVKMKLEMYDSSVPMAASADILSSASNEVNKRKCKINSSEVDWEGYRIIAKREMEMMQGKIERLTMQPNAEQLNHVLDSINDKLYKTAKRCEKRVETVEKPVEQGVTASMVTADEKLKKYTSGLCSWEEWNDTRKEAVTTINKKHYAKLIRQWNETISSDDPKSIWEKIDWKGNCSNKDIFDESPEVEGLAEQFKSKDSIEDENLLDLDFGNNNVPELDQEISLDEIVRASQRLKEGKSTSDGWVPRMVTEVSDVLYPILLLIFNIILRYSIFPVKWWHNVVVALFKNKGSRLISKNYRPVSLVEMLSKLFDFVLLDRFKKWFVPHDMQTAYQKGKSCSDHIFFIRCLTEQFNADKRKLFITAIDFDGAFDRVKRSTLLRKLVVFGAGSVFVACLANIYSMSINTIYSNGASVSYMLYAGIKQGLPLSPYLFLFYIDDVFAYLDGLFVNDILDTFDKLHILIHADDANLFATTKELMIRKLQGMLSFCKKNSIILQSMKCYFTVVNGTHIDKTTLAISPDDSITHTDHLEILGSHISGNINTDLSLHFKKRFINIIKYYNYIKVNDIAPVAVKLTVFKACVMSTLLYNCEAFGPNIPESLEEMYHKMLKAALGVRNNCPNLTILVESGCLPLRTLIHSRQLQFYRRFRNSVKENSVREAIFNQLITTSTTFLKHYINLDNKYTDGQQIISEHVEELHSRIRNLGANQDVHYKYWMYLQMNPELKESPFLNRIDVVGKAITKFRLGSHTLKIETGRWTRTPRQQRLCRTCNELGDESHVIYRCSEIYRGDLHDLPQQLSSLWTYSKVNVLFKRIRDAEYIG